MEHPAKPSAAIRRRPRWSGTINALKNAELNLVVDLVQMNEGDLEHVKNLGEMSIDEIKTALAALGLSLGMRIDPNVLGALGRGAVK